MVAIVAVVAAVAGWAAYVRFVQVNFHVVVEGEVYRSAQPSPEQLAEWVETYELKTVVNLRGQSDRAFYHDERRVLERLGVTMLDVRLTGSRMPMAGRLKKLVGVFESAQRPMLLHCGSGIERAGVASVMAAMAIGGRDYQSARDEVSLRTLHVGSMDSRIMKTLVEYEDYCRREGLSTGRWEQFKRWVCQEYYPYYYYIEIESPPAVRGRERQVVQFPVTVTNRSRHVIPMGDETKQFSVVTFLRPFAHDREFNDSGGPRLSARGTPLPRVDLRPGQSVEVMHSLPPLKKQWEGVLLLDVMELTDGRNTTFGLERSTVATFKLTVDAENEGKGKGSKSGNRNGGGVGSRPDLSTAPWPGGVK